MVISLVIVSVLFVIVTLLLFKACSIILELDDQNKNLKRKLSDKTDWEQFYLDLEDKYDSLQDDYDNLAKLQFRRLTEKK